MFDSKQIYKIDSFLTEPEVSGFHKIIEHYSWHLKNSSYDNRRVFWFKDLWGEKEGKEEYIETTFRGKIQDIFGVKLETVELYLNGQTHSQCGSIHSDEVSGWDPHSEYITLVYYVNKEWSPELGGFTVIFDESKQMHINYPKPNSVVLFNSRFEHVGLEPTVHCNTMRVTLAHKMRVVK